MLSVDARLQINNLIYQFEQSNDKKTAQEIYDLLPNQKKPGKIHVSRKTVAASARAPTDIGSIHDEEETISTKTPVFYQSCGNYKVHKNVGGLIIYKSSDIDERGVFLSEFEDGDRVSLTINFKNGRPDKWGFGFYKKTEFRFFNRKFCFSKICYFMQKFI